MMNTKNKSTSQIFAIIISTLIILAICGILIYAFGYRYIRTDEVRFSGWVKDDKPVSGSIRYIDGTKGKLSTNKDGELIIKYSTGDVYEGDLLGVIRHGNGKITYKNGNIYEGAFVNNVRTGYAEITYADGSTYKGNVENGLPHGSGLYTFSDGSYYFGEFNMGAKHGVGEYRASDSSCYFGTFENDLKHGSEICTVPLADGSVYTGECYLRFPSGATYVGDFVHDMRSGQGTYTWESGEKYTGGFVGGLFHGHGVYTFADGTTHADEFENGEIIIKENIPTENTDNGNEDAAQE